jgi:large subunit ribosomal protein L24e
MRKKNPRTVPWTKTFRRLHRKTAADAVVKRRSHKAARVNRAIVGADLQFIQEVRAKHVKVDRSAKAKAIRSEVADRKAAKK